MKFLKLVGLLLGVLFVLFLLRAIYDLFTGKVDKAELHLTRAETDAKINQLSAAAAAAIAAVREENRQNAQAIVNKLQKSALPEPTKHKGTIGFAGTEPEAI